MNETVIERGKKSGDSVDWELVETLVGLRSKIIELGLKEKRGRPILFLVEWALFLVLGKEAYGGQSIY